MSSKASSDVQHDNLIDNIIKTDQSNLLEVYVFSFARVYASARCSSAIAALVLVLSLAQLLPFVFTVETWSSSLSDFLSVIKLLRFQYLLAKTSYTAYAVILLILLVVGILTLGIAFVSAWFSREEPHDSYSTTASLLHFCTGVFGKMLYVSYLGLALGLLDCHSDGAGGTVLKMYPTVTCWKGNHITVAIGAGILALIAFFLAISSVAMSVGMSLGKNKLASPRFSPLLTELLAQTIVIVLAIVIKHDSVVWPAIQVVCFGWMCKVMVMEAPYFYRWVNLVQSAIYAVLAQAAAVALVGRIILTVGSDTNSTRSLISILVFVLMVVSIPGGLGASFFRQLSLGGLRRYRQIADEDATLQEPMTFSHPAHYEISTRFVYESKKPHDQEIELAENILLGGLKEEPNCVWLLIVKATFLTEIRKNITRSEAILNEARNKSPSFSERYLISLREEINNSKIQTSANGGSLDTSVLLNLSIAKATQKMEQYDRLLRSFYVAVSARQVSPDRISRVLQSMVALRKDLRTSLTRMLKTNKNSAPVLRLFGHFMNYVHNDAAKGCAFLIESDRIENEMLEARRRAALFDIDLQNVDDAVDRVVTIDRFGTIFRVTTRLSRMFGFQDSRSLLGQNVSILMPPTHCVQHDGYLHKFHEGTKPAKILNQERIILAQNAKGYTFPVKIYVFPLQGASHTSEAYISRILPVAKTDTIPDEIADESPMFAANDSGQIISFNKQLLELLQTTHSELYGTELMSLIDHVDPSMTVFDLPESMEATTLAFGSVKARNLTLTFDLISNSKIRFLTCVVTKPEMDVVINSMGSSDETVAHGGTKVPAFLGMIGEDDDHSSRSESSLPGQTDGYDEQSHASPTPRVIMLKDLMGVSKEDLSDITSGKTPQSLSGQAPPWAEKVIAKPAADPKSVLSSSIKVRVTPQLQGAAPLPPKPVAVRGKVSFGTDDDVKPITPHQMREPSPGMSRPFPSSTSSGVSNMWKVDVEKEQKGSVDVDAAPQEEAAADHESSIGGDSVINGHEEEFRVATQHDAILDSLAGTRLGQVLRYPVNVTRLCLVLCLISHFAWFGGLWSNVTKSYIVPGAGTAVANVPSIQTYEAINTGEGTKHAQIVCFYTRVLRSGCAQGNGSFDILEELHSNARDVRFHFNLLENYIVGHDMKSTIITVRDFSANGAIVTRQMSVWDTFQEIISGALFLNEENAVLEPPPREWMFIMLNGPTVAYQAMAAMHEQLLDGMKKDISNLIIYAVCAFAISVFLMMMLLAFGLRPMIAKMTKLRVMLMHLYLSVPRGTARGLAKKETETPSDWNAEKKSHGGGASKKHEVETEVNDEDSEGSIDNAPSVAWGNIGPSSGGRNIRPLTATVSLSGKGDAGGGYQRTSMNNLLKKKESTGKAAPLSERIPLLQSLRQLLSFQGEEHQFSRGKDNCKFRINVSQKLKILLACFFFICCTTLTYVLFYIIQSYYFDVTKLLHGLFALYHQDLHSRFITNEVSGGWDLFPRAELMAMQRQSIAMTTAQIEYLSPQIEKFADMIPFWQNQDCFSDVCDPLDELPDAKARGFYSLHNLWTSAQTRVGDAAVIRNQSIIGTAITTLTLDNVTDATFAVWEGTAFVDYGISQATELKAHTVAPPLIVAFQIVILILVILTVGIIEFGLLRQLSRTLTDELSESTHVLAHVPDYLGFPAICERERRKSFGLFL